MDGILLSDVREGRERLRLDPRTKLLLLAAGNASVMLAPSLVYEMATAACILAFGLASGVYRFTLKMALLYLLLVLVQTLGPVYLPEAAALFVVTFAVFLRKIFPCAMLGGVLIATTRVNEFMTAMNKLRLPRTLIVPLAVTLRYFPAAHEEWMHIREAMAMRGVSSSVWGFLRHPARTAECLLVPMMITASRMAEEMSAAAVTRGIDNPAPRTCMQQLGFGAGDGICILLALLLPAGALLF